jgi:hypothetical protein
MTGIFTPADSVSKRTGSDGYVVYGLGNFLARHAPCCDAPPTRDGMIPQVRVTERHGRFAVRDISYTPTYVDARTVMILPVTRVLRQPGLAPGAARLGVAPDEHP